MNAQSQVTPEFRPHVAVIGGQIKTTSVAIAKHFNKRHDNVIQAIEKLECSPEFAALNFKESKYLVEAGKNSAREEKMYEITRDGFMFLAMGFTGKQAAQWKEAYILAFNRMESQLLEKPEPLPKQAIETFRVRILTCFDRGAEPTQQVVPYSSCIIDPDNIVQLKTFINEEVPVELMLDVINAASQKLARNLKNKN